MCLYWKVYYKARTVMLFTYLNHLFNLCQWTINHTYGNINGQFLPQLCRIHHFGIKKPQSISQTGRNQKQLQNAWKSLKSGMENVKPKKVWTAVCLSVSVCLSVYLPDWQKLSQKQLYRMYGRLSNLAWMIFNWRMQRFTSIHRCLWELMSLLC